MSSFTFYYIKCSDAICPDTIGLDTTDSNLSNGVLYQDVVCKIIEKLYKSKQNCLLLLKNQEQVELFNTKLWTFSKLSFIPHGSAQSINLDNASYCHTWISNKVEFVNNPECLVTCNVETSEFNKFKKVIDVFDNLDASRQRLLNYNTKDYTLWIQSNGNWQEGRL